MNRADGVRVAYPLFQAEGGGSTPTSALQLRFDVCSLATARGLNRLWHSRLPSFPNVPVKVCYVAEFDGLFYASAIWSHPVARVLPQTGWLELRRFAIAPDAPKNTASRMLGWMSKDAVRRFANTDRLISYQDTAVHTGTIYRACGWTIAERDELRSRPWNNVSRCRNVEQAPTPKERWEKIIRQESP